MAGVRSRSSARGITDILAVDDLTEGDKFVNLVDCKIADYMDKDDFRRRVLDGSLSHVRAVLHQGACSDTTERNGRYMLDNNYRVTLELLEFCQARAIPFIYASSAAVYGGSSVYVEDPANEGPLNVYGYSKLLFDQVLRTRMDTLKSQVVGLRYFNVYGPHEQHKGRMASVAFHNMNQFLEHGHVRLFAGWDGYVDGGQSRDFISVEDVVAVNLHFLDNPGTSGIFNCGTGRAVQRRGRRGGQHAARRARRGRAVAGAAGGTGPDPLYPVPGRPQGRYQSYTQADVSRLRAAGFTAPMRDADGRGRVRALLARPQVSRCRMPALPGNKPPPCLVMPAVFVGSRSIPGTRICRRGCFRSPPRRQLPAIAMICGWRDNRRVRFLSGDPHACIRCSIQRLVPAGRHSLHPEAGVRPPSGAAPAVRASGRRRPASA